MITHPKPHWHVVSRSQTCESPAPIGTRSSTPLFPAFTPRSLAQLHDRLQQPHPQATPRFYLAAVEKIVLSLVSRIASVRNVNTCPYRVSAAVIFCNRTASLSQHHTTKPLHSGSVHIDLFVHPVSHYSSIHVNLPFSSTHVLKYICILDVVSYSTIYVSSKQM